VFDVGLKHTLTDKLWYVRSTSKLTEVVVSTSGSIGWQCYIGLLTEVAVGCETVMYECEMVVGWQTDRWVWSGCCHTDIFLTDGAAEAVPPTVVIPVDLTASEKAPDNVTTALLDTDFVVSPRRYPTSEFTQFWIVLKRTLLFSRRDWVRLCHMLHHGSN
jgi:hypothetical protein